MLSYGTEIVAEWAMDYYEPGISIESAKLREESGKGGWRFELLS